jgi:hypothetical protein
MIWLLLFFFDLLLNMMLALRSLVLKCEQEVIQAMLYYFPLIRDKVGHIKALNYPEDRTINISAAKQQDPSVVERRAVPAPTHGLM